jgi:hypothetical protein
VRALKLFEMALSGGDFASAGTHSGLVVQVAARAQRTLGTLQNRLSGQLDNFTSSCQRTETTDVDQPRVRRRKQLQRSCNIRPDERDDPGW